MCRQVSSAGECTDDDRHDLPAPALGEITVTIRRIRDVEAPLAIGR